MAGDSTAWPALGHAVKGKRKGKRKEKKEWYPVSCTLKSR